MYIRSCGPFCLVWRSNLWLIWVVRRVLLVEPHPQGAAHLHQLMGIVYQHSDVCRIGLQNGGSFVWLRDVAGQMRIGRVAAGHTLCHQGGGPAAACESDDVVARAGKGAGNARSKTLRHTGDENRTADGIAEAEWFGA